MIPPNPPSDLPPPGNQPDDFWSWDSLDEPAPPHGAFEWFIVGVLVIALLVWALA